MQLKKIVWNQGRNPRKINGGGRKQGRDWITGQLTKLGTTLLRVVMLYFKVVLNWMHRNNGQGLLKAKISLLVKKLCLGHNYPP